MAYYDALVAAWNAGTVPATYSGSPLTGLTTVQKLANLNGWNKAGVAPRLILPTYQIYNAIVPSEFQALSAALQQLVRDILSMGTVDASPGTNVRTVLAQAFAAGSVTRTNLVALDTTNTPSVFWTQNNGYSTPLSMSDVINAGLT